MNIIHSHGWSIPTNQADQAKNISAKFKNLRKIFKDGQKSIPTLKTNITNVKDILLFIEIIEDYRDLTLAEWNFKEILRTKLNGLLDQQKTYWRQRGATRWAQLGDTNKKFFHANASIRRRGNLIKQLVSDQGITFQSHNGKELIIWQEFKERSATSAGSFFPVDPSNFVHPVENLSFLEEPFLP